MKLEARIDSMKNDIIKETQAILKYPSTQKDPEGQMPFGKDVHECLIHTLNLCESLGFRTKNVDNYAGYAEIGTGDELIGILVHLDVVPEGDHWDYPPYGAEIHDGKIYARGAIDDKGPAIAAIFAMKALLDSTDTINKRIRIIFGTNEETGWEGINYYLKHEEIPSMAFTPDADFPAIHGEKGIMVFKLEKDFKEALDDGGIVIRNISGGNAPNMVPDYAQAHLECGSKKIDHILNAYNEDTNGKLELIENDDGSTLIKSYGISAHGSTPELGNNAISHLMCFLDYLDLQIGDATNYVRAYQRLINTEYNGQSIGCGLEDSESGKLIFNVGMIDMDENKGAITVNVRYPVTFNEKTVLDSMKDKLDFDNITIKPIKHKDPIFLPKDHPLVSKLMKVYQEHTGDNSEPIVIGGGTYARAMANAVAFGPMMSHQKDLAHQKNEYIDIDHLIDITKIYSKALLELLY